MYSLKKYWPNPIDRLRQDVKKKGADSIYGGDVMSGLEGQKAPTFNLEGSDGKKHSLADYAGKNVILWFYPKDDTPG